MDSLSEEEECHGFYDNLYESTPKINIQSYFHEYSQLISAVIGECETITDYMKDDIDESKLDILTKYCSVDKLTVPGEIEKRTRHRRTWRKEIFETEQVPEDVDLNTINKAKIRRKLKKEFNVLKYRGETPIHYEKMNSVEEICATPGQDTLIYLKVYAPYRTTTALSVGKKTGRISLDNVIAIRGQQTLADLRDKITCLSDFTILTDVSKNISEDTGPSAKDVYPSGFFYIEGTFYNDDRFTNSSDNSNVIIEWANSRKYGPFKIASLKDTVIDHMTVKFGFPWVYQHQGRCEHIIVFSDARLFGKDDELSLLVYPRITRMKYQHTRYCMTCGTYSASWITQENTRLPHNPCFFCDRCFKSYNYIDGKKVGNFKAYRYPRDKKLENLINQASSSKNKKS